MRGQTQNEPDKKTLTHTHRKSLMFWIEKSALKASIESCLYSDCCCCLRSVRRVLCEKFVSFVGYWAEHGNLPKKDCALNACLCSTCAPALRFSIMHCEQWWRMEVQCCSYMRRSTIYECIGDRWCASLSLHIREWVLCAIRSAGATERVKRLF